MSSMVCQHCGKNPATIHLTEIKQDGERLQLDFCEACATEQGVAEMPLPTMLSGMIQATSSTSSGEGLRCPHCGITFRDFRSKGRLGCPMDYEVFKEPLVAMLRAWHGGATRHEGRLPRGRLEIETTVSERLLHLRRELRTAIESENYESAAKIRDEIQSIERGRTLGEAVGGPSPVDPV